MSVTFPSIPVLLAAAAVGAMLGAAVGSAPLRLELSRTETQLATVERDHARQLAAAADAASVVMHAAQQRGNALSAGLLAAESEIQTMKEQRDEALVRATTGRRCLDAGALRVLDDARQPKTPAPVPVATGGAAAPGATTAAGLSPAGGGEWASDTDVARWANHAQLAYDTCRARLDALIDWHGEPPQ